ncbi:MAG: FtsQ-type POTRA domain-containing protein [Spirochaetales bacterium]|nr:FtsQ-type POTRA domain-containing protein [Spirochaetales bacterium]
MTRRIAIYGATFVVLLLLLLLLALSHLPFFTISQVQVKIDGPLNHVPSEISDRLSTLVGQGIFRVSLRSTKKRIEQLPIVSSLALSRDLPSTVRATISFIDSPVFLQSEDGERSYLVDGRTLVPIENGDAGLWADHLPTIEVPLEYALLMERYGTDSVFASVMALTRGLSGEASLITHIKYDNNSINSFGKMVLDLPSLNARLRVREPVDPKHVQTALYWIEQDRKEDLSFLSSGIQRYDLYKEALVRR